MEKNKTEQLKEQVNKIEEIKQNFVDYLGEEYQFDYAILKAQDSARLWCATKSWKVYYDR